MIGETISHYRIVVYKAEDTRPEPTPCKATPPPRAKAANKVAESSITRLQIADQSGNISVADHITGGLHFTTLPCFEVPASTETLTLIGYLVQE
jgi:hypothetical protein